MEKYKSVNRALSVFLSLVIIFTMISAGIIAPETKISAEAAVFTANNYDTLCTAINNANASQDTSIIKLTQSFTKNGATAALPEITKNVIFDFNGYSMTFAHKISYNNNWDNHYEYQLPSQLAGVNEVRDYVEYGMFNVGSAGSLQIINSSATAASLNVETYVWSEDNAASGRDWWQRPIDPWWCVSSSGVYSAGALILGDKYDSGKNNFTICTSALTGTNDKGYDRNCTVNSYAVTINGDNAKLFMYGGALESVARTRVNYNGYHKDRCFTLNIQNCYSADIYGGRIDIPGRDECGLRNSDDTASDFVDAYFSCIRSNSPYVYIFDVESFSSIYLGADTGKDNLAYAANVFSTTGNAAHIYGGNFKGKYGRGGGNSTCKGDFKIIRGPYKIAQNNNINPPQDSGPNYKNISVNTGETKSAELVAYTLFVFSDENARNGLYPWRKNTFHDFITAYTATSDVYYGAPETKTYFDDVDNHFCPGTKNYRRNGYTQAGWRGKTTPYGDYNINYTHTGAVPLNGSYGGSLFLAPKWDINTYNITYNKNDSIGVTKAKMPASYPSSYTIASIDSLPTPERIGYTFGGWKLKSVNYRSTDDGAPWTVDNAYPAGEPLLNKYGDIELEAQWTEVSYRATFDLDGGNYNGSAANPTLNYSVNTGFNFLAGVTKEHYTFNGTWKCTRGDGFWQASDNLYQAGDSSQTSTETNPVYGNPTFKAQYTPLDYTLTYDYNRPNISNEQEVYNIESTNSLRTAARPGYGFIGWKPTESVGSWNKDAIYPANTSLLGKYGNVTLVAQWREVTYTLSVTLAQGESLSSGTQYNYAYDVTPTLATPVKNGYRFIKWEVTDTSAGADNATPTWTVGERFESVPAQKIGNVVIKPLWEIETYHITYNENGGAACTDRDYQITDVVTLATTSKGGYDFGGWSVEANAGNWTESDYAAGANLSGMYGDVTLKAKWNLHTYVVTLNPNGGEIAGSGSVVTLTYKTTETTSLPSPVRTGFAFKGWKVTDYSAGASWTLHTVYQNQLPANEYGDLTLTAEWEHRKYTISFQSTGSDPSDVTYYIDEGYTIPESSQAGYTFKHWLVASNAGNWTQNEEVFSGVKDPGKYGDVNLIAVFEPISYTIQYKDKDDNVYQVKTYKTNEAFIIDSYSAGGYTFECWEKESSDGNWPDTIGAGQVAANTYFGNITLKPKLEKIAYTITYITGEGVAPIPALTYDIESTETLASPEEKTGHTFGGWEVTTPDGSWQTTDPPYSGGVSVLGKWGNATLTARWIPINYSVTWMNGSDTLETDSTPYGTKPEYNGAEPSKPSNAQYNYIFDGWTKDGAASPVYKGSAEEPFPDVDGDTVYYAHYKAEIKKYNITFIWDTDENSATPQHVETAEWEYGATPHPSATPAKTSADPDYEWRFDGWDPEVVSVIDEATYTAKFTQVLHPRPVTWVINGTETTEYWEVGSTPSYSGVPEKPDENGYKYTFTGWRDFSTNDFYSSDTALPTVEENENYKYIAEFEPSPQTYKANFRLNGGEAVFPTTDVEYNLSDGLEMKTPTKNGYEFSGWTLTPQPAGGGNWDMAQSPYSKGTYTTYWGDVEFTAEWTPIDYTISFNDPDGFAPEAITYNIESALTLPYNFEREGYTLSGWVVSTAGGNWGQGDMLVPDYALAGKYGDVTLAPIWSIGLFTITWISYESIQVSSHYFGDPITPYEPSPRAGYTAVWDPEPPETTPGRDLTFTAIYTPVQYRLKFNPNGGNPIADMYYDSINSDNKTLPTPTRTGANFLGWKVMIGGGSWNRNAIRLDGFSLTGEYGNATLTALWELHTFKITWYAGDETRETTWFYGSLPYFDGTPYKSPTATTAYEFTGWNREITPVYGDSSYTAQFRETEREYIVKWNVDGHEISQTYPYGALPVCPYENDPARAETPEYSYLFSGWSPEVDVVTRDVTYTATFDTFVKLLGLGIDKSAVFIEIGEQEKVNAILSPENASSRDVAWASLDESIAVVDETGMITGISAGQTIIHVSSQNGAFNAYCVVTVSPVFSEEIIISAGDLSTTRFPGDTIILTAEILPENTTDRTLRWSSDNPAVATIDPDTGVITYGNVIGEATITAITDGYAVGSISVATTENPDEVADKAKTYSVVFVKSSTKYIIEGYKCYSARLIYSKGTDVKFRLLLPHYCMANGVQLTCDSEGFFHIPNIDQNYTVIATDLNDIGFPTEDEEPEQDPNYKKGLFARIMEFIRKIIDFFRTLFKKRV